jgi:alpha-aminoadipic semialdehyde synthase
VDKLPTELPREASESFGNALMPFVPELASTPFSQPFARLKLSPEVRDAVIVHRGTLRPGYAHLRKLAGAKTGPKP